MWHEKLFVVVDGGVDGREVDSVRGVCNRDIEGHTLRCLESKRRIKTAEEQQNNLIRG